MMPENEPKEVVSIAGGSRKQDSEFGHQHDQAYGSQYCPTWSEGDRLYQAKISGSSNEK